MEELLIKLRTTLGLSQNAIAKKLGVSQRSYSYWEKGEKRPSPLSIQKIITLAKKHLSSKELNLFEFYQLHLSKAKSERYSGYSFLDVKSLVKNYKKLQTRVNKLEIELKIYRQLCEDFKLGIYHRPEVTSQKD